MGQSVQQKPVHAKTYAVSTAAPTYLDCMQLPFPISVSAIVGSGGSLAIAYSTTPGAAGNPGSANWFNWALGTVTSNSNDVLLAPCTAMRFTATTAAGTVEVCA